MYILEKPLLLRPHLPYKRMRLSIHCLLNLRSLLVQFGLRAFLDHNNAQVPLSTYNYITNCNCIIHVLFIGSVDD